MSVVHHYVQKLIQFFGKVLLIINSLCKLLKNMMEAEFGFKVNQQFPLIIDNNFNLFTSLLLYRVNNKNTRTTSVTLSQCIDKFKQISQIILVFPLLAFFEQVNVRWIGLLRYKTEATNKFYRNDVTLVHDNLLSKKCNGDIPVILSNQYKFSEVTRPFCFCNSIQEKHEQVLVQDWTREIERSSWVKLLLRKSKKKLMKKLKEAQNNQRYLK